MDFIHTVWRSRDAKVFPGPHPVSLERKHFRDISSQPYAVCEKTDGTRYLLVCTMFNGTRICALVNRAFQIRKISLALPVDTLLDGELVGDKVFNIYDGVIVKGENITHKNLTERLACIQSVIGGPSVGIKLKVKKMWALNEFDKLCTLTQDDPAFDGYIFTPINEPVRTETHETLFKWKPLSRITVDFLCSSNGLYIWDRNIGFVKVQNIESRPEENQKILECIKQCSTWVPIKIRTDKNHPNNRRTYLRTLVNIKEAITVDELVKTVMLGSIKEL